MAKSEVFHVNYYVGTLLAQGGNVWFEDDKIIFSPTSALDRAMGAENVEISLQNIRDVEYKGDLFRTIIFKTEGKVHKFEGSQVRKIWEYMQSKITVPHVTPGRTAGASPAATNGLACDQCSKSLQPGFSFCPYCGNRVKSVCNGCRRTIALDWAVCAFCGWKFSSPTR